MSTPTKSQLELLESVLRIEGFQVTYYNITEGIGISVHLAKKDPNAKCPHCGSLTNKLHQNHWYVVRDLPLMELPTFLRVNRRQMRCEHCGKKFSEDFDWVKKKRVFTARFRERIVRDVLEGDIKNVAKRHGVSEQEIRTMLKSIEKEIIEEKPKSLKRLGIDEIALVKGQKNYIAVLVDLDKGTIIEILEKRTKESLRKCLKSWGDNILSQIEEVSIDLWQPYKSVSKELMPQAEVVADRFHVIKQVNKELDRERRSQKREAEKIEEKAKKEEIVSTLKGSKYALLKNEKDLTKKQREKLEEVRKFIPSIAEMHQLKEEFREVFEASENRKEGFEGIIHWLTKAQEYFPESCKTIENWLMEIVAYFDHGTTQGVVEGINNKLKLIKRKAYGFRNFDNFRMRSLLSWCFSD